MRKKEKSILDKLDLNSIKVEAKPMIDAKEILKHPATKIIIAGIAVYGLLYVSTHFINIYAKFRRAIQNARNNTTN